MIQIVKTNKGTNGKGDMKQLTDEEKIDKVLKHWKMPRDPKTTYELDGNYVKRIWVDSRGVKVTAFLPFGTSGVEGSEDDSDFYTKGTSVWDCHKGNKKIFTDKGSDMPYYAAGNNHDGKPFVGGIYIDLWGGSKAKIMTDMGFKPKNDPQYRTVRIEWRDYGKGDLTRKEWDELITFLRKQKKGTPVVVSCMGGHGRTGTAMSILLCLMTGYKKCPVTKLRKMYCEKAVESDEQIKYIEDITGVKIAEAMKPSKPLYTGTGQGYSYTDSLDQSKAGDWYKDSIREEPYDQHGIFVNEHGWTYDEWQSRCDNDPHYKFGKYGFVPRKGSKIKLLVDLGLRVEADKLADSLGLPRAGLTEDEKKKLEKPPLTPGSQSRMDEIYGDEILGDRGDGTYGVLDQDWCSGPKVLDEYTHSAAMFDTDGEIVDYLDIDIGDRREVRMLMEDDDKDPTLLLDIEREQIKVGDGAWWCPNPCGTIVETATPCPQCGDDRYAVYVRTALERGVIIPEPITGEEVKPNVRRQGQD